MMEHIRESVGQTQTILALLDLLSFKKFGKCVQYHICDVCYIFSVLKALVIVEREQLIIGLSFIKPLRFCKFFITFHLIVSDDTVKPNRLLVATSNGNTEISLVGNFLPMGW